MKKFIYNIIPGMTGKSYVLLTDLEVPSLLSPVDTGYGSGEGKGTASVITGSQSGSVSSVEDTGASGKDFV